MFNPVNTTSHGLFDSGRTNTGGCSQGRIDLNAESNTEHHDRDIGQAKKHMQISLILTESNMKMEFLGKNSLETTAGISTATLGDSCQL